MPVDIYEGLVSLWTDQGLDEYFHGGLIVARVPPGTEFPYSLMVPVSDAIDFSTNEVAAYRHPLITIEAIDQNFDFCKVGVYKILDAILAAGNAVFTDLTRQRVMYIRQQDITYQEEQRYYRGLIDFEARTANVS